MANSGIDPMDGSLKRHHFVLRIRLINQILRKGCFLAMIRRHLAESAGRSWFPVRFSESELYVKRLIGVSPVI